MYIAAPVTVILIFQRIYQNKNSDLVPALKSTIVFFYLHGIIWYHFVFTDFGASHTRVLLYVGGANFSKLCGLTIMAHVSNSKLNLTRWSNILITSLIPLNLIYFKFNGAYLVDHGTLLWVVFFALFICLFHVFFCTTYQFSRALNI